MNTTVQTVPEVKQPKAIKPGVFNGALLRFQVSAYGDLVRAGIEKQSAHKIAADFGSDLGRLMATDPDLSARIGKANSHGESKINLKGAGYIKSSPAMAVIRTAQVTYDLHKEGLLASKDMPELQKTLAQYVEECDTWADAQTWDVE